MTPTPEEVRSLVARLRDLQTRREQARQSAMQNILNRMPADSEWAFFDRARAFDYRDAADALEAEHAARLAAEKRIAIVKQEELQKLVHLNEQRHRADESEARAQALEAALRALVDAVEQIAAEFTLDVVGRAVVRATEARELLEPKGGTA